MNEHRIVPSVSRWLLFTGCLILTAGVQQPASGADPPKFRRIEPQFIAALGDPGATSGNGAQLWGFWNQDPGPRACKLDHYPQLKATGVRRRSGSLTLRIGGWKNTASSWRSRPSRCLPG